MLCYIYVPLVSGFMLWSDDFLLSSNVPFSFPLPRSKIASIYHITYIEDINGKQILKNIFKEIMFSPSSQCTIQFLYHENAGCHASPILEFTFRIILQVTLSYHTFFFPCWWFCGLPEAKTKAVFVRTNIGRESTLRQVATRM